MRTLKHHEKKLLKKVNFLQWKNEHNHREIEVIRRYHLQDRDDYKKYNRLCGMVTKLVSLLKQLDPRDPARLELTDLLLDKLYDMVLKANNMPRESVKEQTAAAAAAKNVYAYVSAMGMSKAEVDSLCTTPTEMRKKLIEKMKERE